MRKYIINLFRNNFTQNPASGNIFERFYRNLFVRGFFTGVATHKGYDYIQNSLSDQENSNNNIIIKAISTKIKDYDTNHDGNITLGEIIDGTLKDLKHYENKTDNPCDHEDDPTVLFVIKDEHHDIHKCSTDNKN